MQEKNQNCILCKSKCFTLPSEYIRVVVMSTYESEEFVWPIFGVRMSVLRNLQIELIFHFVELAIEI